MTPEMVREFLPLRSEQYEATINRLIDSVTAQVEAYIRQDVLQKVVRSEWRYVPQRAILSRGVHQDVLSVKVISKYGEEAELTSDQYAIEGMSFWTLTNIEGSGRLVVDYISGYTKDQRPPQVRDAILQEISLQFKNRQDPDTPAMVSMGNISLEARHLLNSLIRFSL